MPNRDVHPTDQELLLLADGELPARRAAQVGAHLAACWGCRIRMADTEGTIAGFLRAYRQGLDSQLPPIAGSRALLKARLAEVTAKARFSWWRSLFQAKSAVMAAAYIGSMSLVICLVIALLLQHSSSRQGSSAVDTFERGAVPDPSLTPGAMRKVTMSDVCAMPHEDVVRNVSTSLRQEILQEYGIGNARADDYEIDYLIAPGLGGTEDIHNLWPEPYASTWNAHVKDALEERLHEMVCSGQLDLPTAQHDIATDWIAAYRKYFHAERPLLLSGDVIEIANRNGGGCIENADVACASLATSRYLPSGEISKPSVSFPAVETGPGVQLPTLNGAICAGGSFASSAPPAAGTSILQFSSVT